MRVAIRKPAPRGACPGALRPMQSGDGLIVRVRPHGGAIAIADLLALAEAADRHGNGEIDLTRRANLQLRGLSERTLGPVQELLQRLDLLDASPEAEAIRNIVVAPLTGLDPDALIDGRGLARDLGLHLGKEERLWRLPPKFGFAIDGGGRFSLDDERADIRLRAVDGHHFALGLDGEDGVRWIGLVAAKEAAGALLRAAGVFAASLEPGARTRMREAGGAVVAAIEADLSLPPLTAGLARRAPDLALGLIELGAERVAVAVGLPFGRISAGTVRVMAAAALSNEAAEIVLSPWRTIYIPLADRARARAVLATAARHDLVTRTGDPITRIDACPGAPACGSASMATRSAARRLAALMPALGIASAHVSGCPKGCARSAPADLVLVAEERRFGVIRNGLADDAPVADVSQGLDDLPARLAELRHG